MHLTVPVKNRIALYSQGIHKILKRDVYTLHLPNGMVYVRHRQA